MKITAENIKTVVNAETIGMDGMTEEMIVKLVGADHAKNIDGAFDFVEACKHAIDRNEIMTITSYKGATKMNTTMTTWNQISYFVNGNQIAKGTEPNGYFGAWSCGRSLFSSLGEAIEKTFKKG